MALDRLDPQRMRPGLSARVVVRRGRQPAALLAPRAAIDFSGKPPRARSAGGEAKDVKLGPCNAQDCVVLDGLDEGEYELAAGRGGRRMGRSCVRRRHLRSRWPIVVLVPLRRLDAAQQARGRPAGGLGARHARRSRDRLRSHRHARVDRLRAASGRRSSTTSGTSRSRCWRRKGAEVKQGQPVLGFDTTELQRRLDEKTRRGRRSRASRSRRSATISRCRAKDERLRLAEAEADAAQDRAEARGAGRTCIGINERKKAEIDHAIAEAGERPPSAPRLDALERAAAAQITLLESKRSEAEAFVARDAARHPADDASWRRATARSSTRPTGAARRRRSATTAGRRSASSRSPTSRA